MSSPQPNLSEAGSAADLAPVSSVASRSSAQILPVLIRRELWEHRALWMTPLIVAAVLLATTFLPYVGFPFVDDEHVWQHEGSRAALFGLMEWGLALPQYIVMLIVLSFYLTDCLYSERKDRSILFWKSMPLSDGVTVTSKLLTALVVIPLGVFLVALVTSVLFAALLKLRVSLGHIPPGMAMWDTVAWLKVQALMLYGVVVSAFWYAPVAGYLILVSAWARRNVMLWATLPPVIAVLVERFAFGTHYVVGLMEYRTFGIWGALDVEQSMRQTMVTDGSSGIVSLPGMFDSLNLSTPVLDIDLWLGVGVAAALAFAAARIRRYRDDT